MEDGKSALQVLIQEYETSSDEPIPYESRLNNYAIKHDMKVATPEVLLDILMDFYTSMQNTEHSQLQRVFDYNMDDIEGIMREYSCTFNEALSLLISRFRGLQRQSAKMSEGSVHKEIVSK
jgi:hypothetical protein